MVGTFEATNMLEIHNNEKQKKWKDDFMNMLEIHNNEKQKKRKDDFMLTHAQTPAWQPNVDCGRYSSTHVLFHCHVDIFPTSPYFLLYHVANRVKNNCVITCALKFL
jgi:hypothetical protein